MLGYRVICHYGGYVSLTVCFSIRVCLSRVRLLNELYEFMAMLVLTNDLYVCPRLHAHELLDAHELVFSSPQLIR